MSLGWEALKNCRAASGHQMLLARRKLVLVPLTTLGEDIHRIVNLDIHMITYRSKFLPFAADGLAIFAFDLVGAAALLREATGDHN